MRTPSTLLAALLLATPLAHAATFTVTRADDPAAATCGIGDCSLRGAILAANAAAGADTIAFAIPAGVPNGPVTIAPATPLPPVTGDDTTIDGFSQPGASPGAGVPATYNGTIKVFLDGGALAGTPAGLRLDANRGVVRGLAIRGFAGAQVHVTGSDNAVRGNLIGLSPDLAIASPPTALGVRIAPGTLGAPRGNVIGGTYLANERNVIGGHRTGVLIENAGFGSSFAEENRVSGNFINVGPDGRAPLPGEHGVVVRNGRNVRIGANFAPPHADANDIGGTTGPESFGVVLSGGSRIFVDSNWIGGTQAGVAHPLGTGILVTDGASEVFVQANSILAVRSTGILVRDGSAAAGGTRALLERNDVLSVGGMAVDLGGDGPTANDANDVDVGPNRLVNTPTLTGVRTTTNDYLLDFTLQSEPNTSFNVEAFVANKIRGGGTSGAPRAKSNDPRSWNAVSAIFQQTGGVVTTDATGNASGTVTVPKFLVGAGYALAANTTRLIQTGCCFQSGEIVSIDSSALPDETILVFDKASDAVLFDANAIAYSSVSVLRQGSLAGAVSVNIHSAGGADATPIVPPTGITLTWADGDGTPRSFLMQYDRPEPTRGKLGTPELALRTPVGAVLGTPNVYTLSIANHEDRALINDTLFGGAGGSFEFPTPPP